MCYADLQLRHSIQEQLPVKAILHSDVLLQDIICVGT